MTEEIKQETPLEQQETSEKTQQAEQDLPKEENVDKQQPAAEKKKEKKEKKKSKEEQLREELDHTKDQLLRTLAEYDNFRKRTAKEKEMIYPMAVVDTVAPLIKVYEQFERALTFTCTDTEYKKGIDMIFVSFREALEKLKVEEFGKEGEVFDPNLHNAVMHIEDDSLGENVIAEVLQKGYRIGDRVIQYAMVKTAN